MDFTAVSIYQEFGSLKNRDEIFRNDHIGHIEPGIDDLSKTSKINTRCTFFVGRECRKRFLSISEFTVVVILDDPSSFRFCPSQQLFVVLGGRDIAERILMTRRDQDTFDLLLFL